MTSENIDIEYMVQLWREENQYIAHATPIDVISAGDTAENARAALDEAVHLFLTTAKEHGSLAQVLEEAGYSY